MAIAVKKASGFVALRLRACAILSELLASDARRPVFLQDRLLEEDEADAAWLTEVCSGVLRTLTRLDGVIDAHARAKKPTGKTRRLLQIAVYQLLFQDATAGEKVIFETVEAAKSLEGAGAKSAGFLNAVLRRVHESREAWRNLAFPVAGTAAEKAKWASLPEWIWTRLVHEKGEPWARAFSEASLARPEVWLRLAPELRERAGSASLRLQDASAKLGDAFTGVGDSRAIVQNIAGQKLTERVAEFMRALQIETFLDLCAAPGGKSFGLVWEGFRGVATDKNPRRLKDVEVGSERITGGTRSLEVVDWERAQLPDFWETLSARGGLCVWIDAPCMATGVLRKHPEGRWLRREAELKSLQKIQRGLITDAVARLRSLKMRFPERRLALVYSVCSVLEAEGVEHARDLQFEPEWTYSSAPQEGGDGYWGMGLKF